MITRRDGKNSRTVSIMQLNSSRFSVLVPEMPSFINIYASTPVVVSLYVSIVMIY